jgi:hypothetical protein
MMIIIIIIIIIIIKVIIITIIIIILFKKVKLEYMPSLRQITYLKIKCGVQNNILKNIETSNNNNYCK